MKLLPERHPRALRSGFSLLELLTVMAIITLLGALVSSSVSGIQNSIQLTKAATQVSDHLQYARQAAITRNEPIYLNLCKTSDPVLGESYNLIVITRFSKGGVEELLDRPVRLPYGFAISEDLAWSTLMKTPAGSVEVPINGQKQALSCHRVRFKPSGSASLEAGQEWFLTVHQFRSPGEMQEAPKVSNFITLAIDPATGRVFSYQP